jgi:hypothetical protein
MEKFKQQKMTALEKNLAKQIEALEHGIPTLPADARRKKDEKNWETFVTIAVFIALAGIYIFGAGGWLAVAITGTLLTLIIVESGLFLSLAMGFSAWPLYNLYLWTRDLFSSEKIKAQNKDYDRVQNNLNELKELAAEKNYLSSEINFKLNDAVKCFPSEIFAQDYAGFAQLDLKDQIHRLEQERKKLPAYFRKQKDKDRWANIFNYSAMTSGVGLSLYMMALIMTMAGPPTILLGPVFPVLVVIEAILALIIIGPVMVSSVLHATYLCIRDLFSSAETKTENKEYAQLKKAMSELKKLDDKQSKLDEKINSKLEHAEQNFSQVKDAEVETKKLIENTKHKEKEYVYKLFQEPTTPANETMPVSQITSNTQPKLV